MLASSACIGPKLTSSSSTARLRYCSAVRKSPAPAASSAALIANDTSRTSDMIHASSADYAPSRASPDCVRSVAPGPRQFSACFEPLLRGQQRAFLPRPGRLAHFPANDVPRETAQPVGPAPADAHEPEAGAARGIGHEHAELERRPEVVA